LGWRWSFVVTTGAGGSAPFLDVEIHRHSEMPRFDLSQPWTECQVLETCGSIVHPPGSAPAAPDLTAVEVHIWRIGLESPVEVIERLRDVLTVEERARADRFQFERDRSRFIVGRSALRMILGQYLGIEADRLAFRSGAWGKPGLEDNPTDLRFNLSHSHDLALLAVVRGREVGIDVERLRPLDDAPRLVARFFSEAERAEFLALTEAERQAAFFRGWTRKEAYMKATGQGFSLPLAAFEVPLGPGSRPALLRVAGRPDEPGRWTFRDLDPGPGFAAAVAVEGAGWKPREFRFDPAV
jgi:4'-phosphopantetheinyl transferase